MYPVVVSKYDYIKWGVSNSGDYAYTNISYKVRKQNNRYSRRSCNASQTTWEIYINNNMSK